MSFFTLLLKYGKKKAHTLSLQASKNNNNYLLALVMWQYFHFIPSHNNNDNNTHLFSSQILFLYVSLLRDFSSTSSRKKLLLLFWKRMKMGISLWCLLAISVTTHFLFSLAITEDGKETLFNPFLFFFWS